MPADLVIEAPLTLWERVYRIDVIRQATLLVVLAALWQAYAVSLDNNLVLPSFTESLTALWDGFISGPLLARALTSVRLLVTGYAAGIAAAAVLTLLAISTRVGSDLLNLLTAMFNPLPAIALLPIALLWFGLGAGSILFVLVHAVLWPLALNTHAGFRGVGETLRLAGQSFGLRGIRFAVKILIPAAFPAILSGLKIGWAFAWRTLIAAELVFGVSSGSGGLGWFIFENRNQLEIPNVFAGLLTVIGLGLVVEGVIFRAVERVTIRRWGMQR
ncbi:MAG TPA: ABC transporter permease subunit [Vineibacter terrae]|nr:ABC transporter permease subunit [Vineibacter terrae]HEX2888317.1 ABC transporter permease subunit [Vineibacter terrae]